MFPRRRARLAALCMSIGCSSSRAPTASPPRAEFLLGTVDSTFWVASTDGHVRARGVPLVLTQFGGRYYTLYASDDDRSFDDALLLGERLYRRDIVTGDSLMVFSDTIVPRVAEAYARAHPGERPLTPYEDGSADPATAATAEIDVQDVAGPYLSFEYRVDLDAPNRRSWHAARRGVIDLRTGEERSLTDVFGRAEGARLIATGRRQYEAERDSIVRARAGGAAGDRSTADALRHRPFDDRSFTLSTQEGRPAVIFSLPGHGEGAAGNLVELEPIPVRQADAVTGLIAGAASVDDDGNDRWEALGYQVHARYDSVGEIALVSLASADRREWRVAEVTGPLRRIFWLDRPSLRSTDRAALRRVFSEAAADAEDSRAAMLDNPSKLSLVSAHASREERWRKSARNLRAHDAGARKQHGPRIRRRGAVDDGQVRGHLGIPAQPQQRGHRID